MEWGCTVLLGCSTTRSQDFLIWWLGLLGILEWWEERLIAVSHSAGSPAPGRGKGWIWVRGAWPTSGWAGRCPGRNGDHEGCGRGERKHEGWGCGCSAAAMPRGGGLPADHPERWGRVSSQTLHQPHKGGMRDQKGLRRTDKIWSRLAGLPGPGQAYGPRERGPPFQFAQRHCLCRSSSVGSS